MDIIHNYIESHKVREVTYILTKFKWVLFTKLKWALFRTKTSSYHLQQFWLLYHPNHIKGKREKSRLPCSFSGSILSVNAEIWRVTQGKVIT